MNNVFIYGLIYILYFVEQCKADAVALAFLSLSRMRRRPADLT